MLHTHTQIPDGLSDLETELAQWAIPVNMGIKSNLCGLFLDLCLSCNEVLCLTILCETALTEKVAVQICITLNVVYTRYMTDKGCCPYIWSAQETHPAHSSFRKESPTDLMLLIFVWDETASRTARSKTVNGLHSWSAPHFCMGRDCLWDSKEQNREYTFLSILYVAPCCPRSSLVPYKNKEQISCAAHFLCCSLLYQRQSCPIQKWWKSVPPGPSFARNGCPDEETNNNHPG